MKSKWHGGKGSDRRQGSNLKQYEDNWEKIFGNKNKEEPEKKDDDPGPPREAEPWHNRP